MYRFISSPSSQIVAAAAANTFLKSAGSPALKRSILTIGKRLSSSTTPPGAAASVVVKDSQKNYSTAAEPFLNGSTSTYVEEMYNSWLADPASVHAVRKFVKKIIPKPILELLHQILRVGTPSSVRPMGVRLQVRHTFDPQILRHLNQIHFHYLPLGVQVLQDWCPWVWGRVLEWEEQSRKKLLMIISPFKQSFVVIRFGNVAIMHFALELKMGFALISLGNFWG